MYRYKKYFMKQFFSAVLFLLFSLGANAQYDTEFWLPASSPYQNTQCNVILTTINPVAIVNFYSGNTIIATTSVSNGNPVTVLLPINPSTGVTYGMDKFDNNNITTPNGSTANAPAVRISSNVPVTAVVYYNKDNNKELLQLKGRVGLGTAFRVASQTRASGDNDNFGSGGGGSHFVSVMATQDNTVVTFDNLGRTLTDPGQGANFANGSQSVYTFTLNKGESRWLMTTNVNTSLITGGLLTSDKPVSVISGAHHLCNTAGACDAGIDNITPVSEISTEYVACKGRANSPTADYLTVVAHTNNTVVTINGVNV
jgi:hypothetical protein